MQFVKLLIIAAFFSLFFLLLFLMLLGKNFRIIATVKQKKKIKEGDFLTRLRILRVKKVLLEAMPIVFEF